MNTNIRIRDARADEQHVIRELTLAAYEEYAHVMVPSAWRGLHNALLNALDGENAAQRIVAEHNGMVVGSVMLFPPEGAGYGDGAADANWPELRLLAVASEVRGMGVGTALVRECMRRAKQADAKALGLHTSASLQTAIGMYERMGFVRVPEYDFQPEGAELVMAYRKDL